LPCVEPTPSVFARDEGGRMKHLRVLAVVAVVLSSMLAGAGEASAAPPLIKTCTKARNHKMKVVSFLATCKVRRGETTDAWELQSRVARYEACTHAMIRNEDVLNMEYSDAVAAAIASCPVAWPGSIDGPPPYPTTPSAPTTITTCANAKGKLRVSPTDTCKGKKVRDRWENRVAYSDYRSCTFQFLNDQAANMYWSFAQAYADVTSTCPTTWP
jgi:hypothetical protein